MIKEINKINTKYEYQLYKKAIECIPTQLLLTESIKDNNLEWPKEIIEWTNNLKDTANSTNGSIGLAINQIWDKEEDPPSIFIIKLLGTKENNYKPFWQEFINPKIKTSGGTIKIDEKCLSVPDFHKKKSRKKNVTITFQTIENIVPITQKFYSKLDILPIIIQHEYDHLLGKLII